MSRLDWNSGKPRNARCPVVRQWSWINSQFIIINTALCKPQLKAFCADNYEQKSNGHRNRRTYLLCLSFFRRRRRKLQPSQVRPQRRVAPVSPWALLFLLRVRMIRSRQCPPASSRLANIEVPCSPRLVLASRAKCHPRQPRVSSRDSREPRPSYGARSVLAAKSEGDISVHHHGAASYAQGFGGGKETRDPGCMAAAWYV